MYNKENTDRDAEQEGRALKQQGRYTQSRYRWIRLQAEHKIAIERRYFKDMYGI